VVRNSFLNRQVLSGCTLAVLKAGEMCGSYMEGTRLITGEMLDRVGILFENIAVKAGVRTQW